ncbi:MAG: DUF481 domain-containing protein [Hyphomonadaceae bacterium]|nr:DUF481 domain-containing protein [Hyphomonadaceae bacterium]
MSTHKLGLAVASVNLLTLALAAHAQPAEWSGEGGLSAGMTTGNTETTDVGLALDIARETQIWKAALDAQADFGETDGEETKNRLFVAGQLDRQMTDKMYGFGRISYEVDEFSGFDSRLFIGGGLGYEILNGERTGWTVEGGPGLKVDEVKPRMVDGMMVPGETVESFSLFAASNYAFHFNDNVSFSNDTDMLYAQESTQLVTISALTAKLTDALSARVSFDVRHDTDPPQGFTATDTATRVSLVYAIGG